MNSLLTLEAALPGNHACMMSTVRYDKAVFQALSDFYDEHAKADKKNDLPKVCGHSRRSETTKRLCGCVHQSRSAIARIIGYDVTGNAGRPELHCLPTPQVIKLMNESLAKREQVLELITQRYGVRSVLGAVRYGAARRGAGVVVDWRGVIIITTILAAHNAVLCAYCGLVLARSSSRCTALHVDAPMTQAEPAQPRGAPADHESAG